MFYPGEKSCHLLVQWHRSKSHWSLRNFYLFHSFFCIKLDKTILFTFMQSDQLVSQMTNLTGSGRNAFLWALSHRLGFLHTLFLLLCASNDWAGLSFPEGRADESLLPHFFLREQRDLLPQACPTWCPLKKARIRRMFSTILSHISSFKKFCALFSLYWIYSKFFVMSSKFYLNLTSVKLIYLCVADYYSD